MASYGRPTVRTMLVSAAVLMSFALNVYTDDQVAKGDSWNGNRLIVIGFDSLDWQIAEPLLAAGRMPNLRRLIDRGCRIRLQSISPILSPAIWTTIATGRTPSDHGILDFAFSVRKTKAVWNIAEAAGMKVGVVGWWATWPAENLRGYVVTDKVAFQSPGSDRAAQSPLEEGTVSPSLLEDEVAALVLRSSDVPLERLRAFPDLPDDWDTSQDVTEDDRERVGKLGGYVAQAESYRRIGLDLHRRFKPDLDLVYFQSPDATSHVFMGFRPPAMAGVEPERVRWFGQVIDKYYEECDRILGDFAALAEAERASIIVCSDHGFKSGADRPGGEAAPATWGAKDWHREYGLMVCAGAPFASGSMRVLDATVMDVAPTILRALGLPISREMPGSIIEDAFDPAFLRENPARWIDTYEGAGSVGPASVGPASRRSESPSEQEQLKSLIELGYLEADPHGRGRVE